jgi:hypothetical protein
LIWAWFQDRSLSDGVTKNPDTGQRVRSRREIPSQFCGNGLRKKYGRGGMILSLQQHPVGAA